MTPTPHTTKAATATLEPFTLPDYRNAAIAAECGPGAISAAQWLVYELSLDDDTKDDREIREHIERLVREETARLTTALAAEKREKEEFNEDVATKIECLTGYLELLAKKRPLPNCDEILGVCEEANEFAASLRPPQSSAEGNQP